MNKVARTTALMAAAAIAASALVPPAAAGSRAKGEYQTRQSVRNAPPPVQRGPVCVPWCPSDLNPCDPPSFKRADGRCGFEY